MKPNREQNGRAPDPEPRQFTPTSTDRNAREIRHAAFAYLIKREALHIEENLLGGKSNDYSPQCDFTDAEYSAYYLGALTTFERLFETICDELDEPSRRFLGDFLSELRRRVVAIGRPAS